ncbi:MAG TPA: hypothetical protein VNF73_08400, partial [Candidatus Saccharimonadales bacterium]|nr:hypothetical protein [Candidatus Saccharimonadales bacterium]
MAEPAWLAGRRAAALATYTGLPVPSVRDEAWRFTNLRGWDPDSHPQVPSTPALSAPDLPDGVVFSRLATAVGEHPELIERWLGTVVSDGEKFAAGNAAHWDDGVLLHVPAGVRLETPLRAVLDVAEQGSALYHRVLVVLERDAHAVFIEE